MKACKVYHTIVLQMFSGRLCRMVKELKLLAFGLERHASLLSCTLFFLTNFLIHYYYYCISLQPIISIPVCCTSFFAHRMIISHYSFNIWWVFFISRHSCMNEFDLFITRSNAGAYNILILFYWSICWVLTNTWYIFLVCPLGRTLTSWNILCTSIELILN